MKLQEKILIICRSEDQIGGVTSFCNSLFKYHKSDNFCIERFVTGRRPGKDSHLYYLLTIFSDFIRFCIKISTNKYTLVHLNPSLGLVPILRDGFFITIARFLSIKTLVFWHGWDPITEKFVDSHWIFRAFVTRVFGGATTTLVLASAFKDKLIEWHFNKRIIVEVTSVDDCLLEGFTPTRKIEEINGDNNLQLMFFSRIEIEKGILETIDAFLELEDVDRPVSLVIAGEGPGLEIVRQRVNEAGDERIRLVGYVRGEQKRELLERSHVMCLPTRYGEGLPVSILEAMAFGMPIITRPVGGIPDNLIEGENGYYVQSLRKGCFSKFLREIILDRESLSKISKTNYEVAKVRFLSSSVAKRLDDIYYKTVFEV